MVKRVLAGPIRVAALLVKLKRIARHTGWANNKLQGSLTEMLLAETEDAALKTLYAQYNGYDYDTLSEHHKAEDFMVIKPAREEVLGVEIPETDDLNSPDDLLRYAHAHGIHKEDR